MKKKRLDDLNIEQLQTEIKKNDYKGLAFSGTTALFTIAFGTATFIPPIFNIVLSLAGTTGFVFAVQNWQEVRKRLNNKLDQQIIKSFEQPEVEESVEQIKIDLSTEKEKFFIKELSETNFDQIIAEYVRKNKTNLKENIKYFDKKYEAFNNFNLQDHRVLNFVLFCLNVIDNIKKTNENKQYELLDKTTRLDMMLTINALIRQYDEIELSLTDLNKISDIVNLYYEFKDINPDDYFKNKELFAKKEKLYGIKKPINTKEDYVLTCLVMPMAKVQNKMEELNVGISDMVYVDNQEETLLEEVEEAAKIKDEGKVKVKRLERR